MALLQGYKPPACMANHMMESKRAGQLLGCKANSAQIQVLEQSHMVGSLQPKSCPQPGKILHLACTLLTVTFILGKY